MSSSNVRPDIIAIARAADAERPEHERGTALELSADALSHLPPAEVSAVLNDGKAAQSGGTVGRPAHWVIPSSFYAPNDAGATE